ncbi:MAG: lipid-binding SYLF domain-containing protein [Candidatus Acidiferrales bacterium]
MKTIFTFFIAMFLMASTAFAGPRETRKQEDRLKDAGAVMSEILNMPDSIPQSILDRTKCVVVVPSVRKAAFVVGASYGRGTMVCRTGPHFAGPWGAPSMMAVEGASFGLQIGVEATDFVFLITNERGADSLLRSKVKLGGDVAAVAGPVGRDAQADTDAYMRAEILTYSRARGVFAGVSLEGSTLRPDNEANEDLYGRKISAREIVFGPEPPIRPAAAERLIALLEKASPRLING